MLGVVSLWHIINVIKTHSICHNDIIALLWHILSYHKTFNVCITQLNEIEKI